MKPQIYWVFKNNKLAGFVEANSDWEATSKAQKKYWVTTNNGYIVRIPR
jgi:hypothetical protein